MATTRTLQYGNYEFQCAAKSSDSGTFTPVLVVARQAWPTRPREIAVPRGNHTSAEAALDAAYEHGVEWVMNYG